ncbi:Uncharacterised protein [Klebsiella pneumoniae]|nr:Uncharacterised protein [Klebsiella pneumoniae]
MATNSPWLPTMLTGITPLITSAAPCTGVNSVFCGIVIMKATSDIAPALSGSRVRYFSASR